MTEFCNHNQWVTFDCIDGYLHDRDYDYVDPEDKSYPCPKCNIVEYFINEKEMLDGVITQNENYWDDLLDAYVKKFNVTIEYLHDVFSKHEELHHVIFMTGDDWIEDTWQLKRYDYVENENV